MNTYFVEVTDAAQSDLKEIVSYISIDLKNPTSAKRLLIKFKENILSLEKMPNRQNLVNDEALSSRGIEDYWLITIWYFTLSMNRIIK